MLSMFSKSEKIQHNIVSTENEDINSLADEELSRLFPSRKIHRILFVSPPEVDAEFFDFGAAKRGRYWNCPPYGVGIIASHLRNDGVEVRILNLNNEILETCRKSLSKEEFDFDKTWKDILSNEMESFEPDMIGMTCLFSLTHKSAVKVCNEIKRLNPAIPLALGGVHITNCFNSRDESAEILGDFSMVDIFFFFEAELAFKYFVQAVNEKEHKGGLYQLYFNSSPRKLHFSDRLIPSEKELNIIPAHDLMKTGELSSNGVIGAFHFLKNKGTRFTTMLSNRGCRGRCTYCSVNSFNGPGVRHRSVQSVIEEMFVVRDRFGVGHILWLDDDFFHDHNRALTLFNEMVNQDVNMTWDCSNGVIASSCTEEVISAAAKSGCIGLIIGIESGNPTILKNIRKPCSIKHFISAAEVLKKHETISTRGFLIIGFPNESYRMILDTLNLALEMDLDWYNIAILQPLPNTPIFKAMVQQGMVDKVKTKEIRFHSGPYGKIRDSAIDNIHASSFARPFENKNLDDVPAKSELQGIWRYMNFHLNFKRLFKIKSPLKLEQQLKYLLNIAELIAPDDPLPKYFCGYLQNKVRGEIDKEIINKLEECLEVSEYWRNLFTSYGLSPSDLRTGKFQKYDKNNSLPYDYKII